MPFAGLSIECSPRQNRLNVSVGIATKPITGSLLDFIRFRKHKSTYSYCKLMTIGTWPEAEISLILSNDCLRRQSGRLEFQIQRPKADIAPAYKFDKGFAPLRRERSVMFAALATGTVILGYPLLHPCQLDLTRFSRHISASSTKLLECQGPAGLYE